MSQFLGEPTLTYGLVDEEDILSERVKRVRQINNDLQSFVSEFEKYLIENVMYRSCDSIDLPTVNAFDNKYLDSFLRQFPEKNQNELKAQFLFKDGFFNPFKKTIILNFNYTKTYSKYFTPIDAEIINIHGVCHDNANPVNMGFGNENDSFYKVLEDADENELLRFTKSFKYTNNNNYKKLLDLIDADKFQVQVMGHSCGLSDRTLLNTIFEHANCVSIRPFYHLHPSFKNDLGETDNYTELAMNISRHFNKPAKMRERLVNRDSCVPLQKVQQ